MPVAEATTILLIEDDPIDAQLFQRVAKKQNLDAAIEHATDGARGLEALRAHGSDPCVVVLDLNMDGMNGHDFLQKLREDTDLKQAVVFVLTSSNHGRDVTLAYEKNVAGYFNKSDISEFVTLMRTYLEKAKIPALCA